MEESLIWANYKHYFRFQQEFVVDGKLTLNEETNHLFSKVNNKQSLPVVAHPCLNGEFSGSIPGHTNNFKISTYCSSAGHNQNYLM